MMLDITESNERFAAEIASLIERKGHAVAKYEDPDTGACCVLGGLRIAVFGTVDVYRYEQPDDEKWRRYWGLVEWLVDKVGDQVTILLDDHDETIIGKWNDYNPTEKVLAKLREIGGADAPAVPQA